MAIPRLIRVALAALLLVLPAAGCGISEELETLRQEVRQAKADSEAMKAVQREQALLIADIVKKIEGAVSRIDRMIVQLTGGSR